MKALEPDSSVWTGFDYEVTPYLVRHIHAARKLLDVLPKDTFILPLLEYDCRSLPDTVRKLVPPQHIMEMLSDKSAFSLWMRHHGYSNLIPRTAVNKPLRTYPQLFKQTRLNGGNGQVLISNRKEMKVKLREGLWRSRAWISQEAITGCDEYVWHVVCKEGMLLWSQLMKYTLPSDLMIRDGDITATLVSELAPPIMDPLAALLAELRYTGPANIDFKIRNAAPVVLEINPRLGGSLMVPEHTGNLQEAIRVLLEAAEVTSPKNPLKTFRRSNS